MKKTAAAVSLLVCGVLLCACTGPAREEGPGHRPYTPEEIKGYLSEKYRDDAITMGEGRLEGDRAGDRVTGCVSYPCRSAAFPEIGFEVYTGAAVPGAALFPTKPSYVVWDDFPEKTCAYYAERAAEEFADRGVEVKWNEPNVLVFRFANYSDLKSAVDTAAEVQGYLAAQPYPNDEREFTVMFTAQNRCWLRFDPFDRWDYSDVLARYCQFLSESNSSDPTLPQDILEQALQKGKAA